MPTDSKKNVDKTMIRTADKPTAAKSASSAPAVKSPTPPSTKAPAKPVKAKAAPKDSGSSGSAPAAATKETVKTLKKSGKSVVSPEQRYRMIATAAYYLAERRGFHGDYDMQDWISAEAEIDAMIKATS
jgi:hypothetical protein